MHACACVCLRVPLPPLLPSLCSKRTNYGRLCSLNVCRRQERNIAPAHHLINEASLARQPPPPPHPPALSLPISFPPPPNPPSRLLAHSVSLLISRRQGRGVGSIGHEELLLLLPLLNFTSCTSERSVLIGRQRSEGHTSFPPPPYHRNPILVSR